MADNENILISLEPRHAKGIYACTKKVELRRRKMHVVPGTIVWFYEKLPVGAITGYAAIKEVHMSSPEDLWARFGSVSGLTEMEFFTYFSEVTKACALELEESQQLKQPLSLTRMREALDGFQPPQFFIRISHTHPVRLALRSCTFV